MKKKKKIANLFSFMLSESGMLHIVNKYTTGHMIKMRCLVSFRPSVHRIGIRVVLIDQTEVYIPLT